MDDQNRNVRLGSEAIQMLVSSMTQKGERQISEIEVERFLNALARLESGVPTGVSSLNDSND